MRMRSPSIPFRAWAGAAILGACVAFGGVASSDIGVPLDDVAGLADVPGLVEEASKAGKTSRDARIASLARPDEFVLPPSSPAYASVAAIFAELEVARNALLARADEGDNFAYHVRRHMADTSLDVKIVQTKAVFATAYPDNSLLVSRNLLEDLHPADAVRDEWEVRFVLAHELVHLRDGHPLLNWAALQGRSRAGGLIVASTLFNLGSAVLSEHGPDLGSVTFSNEGSSYEALRKNHGFLEFLADYWAYYILKEMKAPSGMALNALSDVAAAQGVMTTTTGGVSMGYLPERIACMRLLDIAPSADTPAPPALDDKYWQCAYRSAGVQQHVNRDRLFEVQSDNYDKEMDRMRDENPGYMGGGDYFTRQKQWEKDWAYEEARLLRSVGAMRRSDAVDTYVDGIPVTAAGDAYRASLALPDLVITSIKADKTTTAFSQQEVAFLDVRVANRGRRPVLTPFSVGLAPRPGSAASCANAGAHVACNRVISPQRLLPSVNTYIDMRLYLSPEALAAARATPDMGMAVTACASGAAPCDSREDDLTNNWAPISSPTPAQPPATAPTPTH